MFSEKTLAILQIILLTLVVIMMVGIMSLAVTFINRANMHAADPVWGECISVKRNSNSLYESARRDDSILFRSKGGVILSNYGNTIEFFDQSNNHVILHDVVCKLEKI